MISVSRIFLFIGIIVQLVATQTTEACGDGDCFKKNTNQPVAVVMNSQPVEDQNIGDKCLENVPLNCDEKYKYRLLTGACNNLKNPHWGMTNSTVVRLLPPVYADDQNNYRKSFDGSELISPATVSHDFFTDHKKLNKYYTTIFVVIMQMMAHDVMQLRLKPVQDKNKDFMGLLRGFTVQENGCNIKPTEHMEAGSSFIDASFLYGSDDVIAKSLRTGTGGLLKFKESKTRMFLPQDPNGGSTCLSPKPTSTCFLSGDFRVNQHPQLALLQTAFFRVHNKLCEQIAKKYKDDEEIYQQVRKIIIGIFQNTLYRAPVMAIFGERCAAEYGLPISNVDGYECSYNENINPTTIAEFQHAAFRIFHSIIRANNTLYKEDRTIAGYFDLKDWFLNPFLIIEKPEIFDQMLIGLTMDSVESLDRFFEASLNDLPLSGPNTHMSLVAVDTDRGRDLGMPNYLTMATLAGYPREATWDDLAQRMDQNMVDRLKAAYGGKIEDIDAYLGMLLEKPYAHSTVGKTLHVILAEAFIRYKDGDRFFFTCDSPAGFSREQLSAIKKTELSFVLCLGSDGIEKIQRNVYRPINQFTNPLVPCKDIINEFFDRIEKYWG